MSPFTKRGISERIAKYAQKYNHTKTERVFENVAGVVALNPFQRKLFDRMSNIAFEGNNFKCFADYDSYLRQTYGDYMTLPPVDQRVSHHSFRVWRK